MVDATDILLDVDDGVATVTLNRPRKRNALSFAMWLQLAEMLNTLDADPGVRAVILTGVGGNFCAGADISEFETLRADVVAAQRYEAATEEATIALRDWKGPTIAAISGYAMGGGCGLALACDLRVGDQTAQMGIPAAKLGIVYGPLDTDLLLRQVGLAVAKRVLFSAQALPFEEGVRVGLIDIPSSTAALDTARDLAKNLAVNAPLSIRGAKKILHALANGSAHRDTAEMAAIVDGSFASSDYAEGRRAFMEKRRPVFVGS